MNDQYKVTSHDKMMCVGKDDNLLSGYGVVEISQGLIGWSHVDPVSDIANEHLLSLIVCDGSGEQFPISCIKLICVFKAR